MRRSICTAAGQPSQALPLTPSTPVLSLRIVVRSVALDCQAAGLYEEKLPSRLWSSLAAALIFSAQRACGSAGCVLCCRAVAFQAVGVTQLCLSFKPRTAPRACSVEALWPSPAVCLLRRIPQLRVLQAAGALGHERRGRRRPVLVVLHRHPRLEGLRIQR